MINLLTNFLTHLSKEITTRSFLVTKKLKLSQRSHPKRLKLKKLNAKKWEVFWYTIHKPISKDAIKLRIIGQIFNRKKFNKIFYFPKPKSKKSIRIYSEIRQEKETSNQNKTKYFLKICHVSNRKETIKIYFKLYQCQICKIF